MNILVVDDTRVILEAISDFLQLEGHHPILARSALEGINMLGQIEIAMVVVSIEMKPLNGFDLASAIRSRNIHAPIIFLSPVKEFRDLYKKELDQFDNCAVIYKHQVSAFIELLDTIKYFERKN